MVTPLTISSVTMSRPSSGSWTRRKTSKTVDSVSMERSYRGTPADGPERPTPGDGPVNVRAVRRKVVTDGVGITVSVVAFALVYGLAARQAGLSLVEGL